jgi:hypothetical protein
LIIDDTIWDVEVVERANLGVAKAMAVAALTVVTG